MEENQSFQELYVAFEWEWLEIIEIPVFFFPIILYILLHNAPGCSGRCGRDVQRCQAGPSLLWGPQGAGHVAAPS